MDKYILLVGFLSLFSFLIIIILFGIIKYFRDLESEFVINYKVLLEVIELYKESVLLNKIRVLQKQYDLNEQSKTNSRQAFEKAKNELISESVKIIIKDHLSKNCIKSLLNRYNVDGLSLLIITHLKR
jgi:hypothetical protein